MKYKLIINLSVVLEIQNFQLNVQRHGGLERSLIKKAWHMELKA